MTDMCHVAAGTHSSITPLLETAVHVQCLLACVASKALCVKRLLTHLFIEHVTSSRVSHAQSQVVAFTRSCFGNQRTNNNAC